MIPPISPRTEKFILQFFAACNPVYYLSRWLDAGFREDAFRSDFERFIADPAFAPPWYGDRGCVQAQLSPLPPLPPHLSLPLIMPVGHVFPVYAPDLDVGLMVPLEIVPSEEWHISDAFGRFAQDQTAGQSPATIFNNLLKCLEQAWRNLHPDRFLPLRWRQEFSLKLLCPVHIEALDGVSLHLPLVVALLRAVGQTPSSLTSGAALPFGNGPVFATGKLAEDGTFGWVDDLEQKLAGFIREYGKHRPAILTRNQLEYLQKSATGQQLLDQIGENQIYPANNLQELMALPELNRGLQSYCGAPAVTEIDGLLSSLHRLQGVVRFDEVAELAGWLGPHVHSPVYRFQLLRQLALVHAHRGQFIQAYERLRELAKVIEEQPQAFGLTEKMQMATAWGVAAFDACDASLAEPYLQEVQHHLLLASMADRARFWGTRCQLYRLAGRLDEAVEAGLLAVAAADQALASEGGRDRNYLIHALLERARRQPATAARDVEEAARWLAQSQGEWAPLGEDRPRRSHLGFCLHYEAEVARLRGRPFSPPLKPPWDGPWGHPWLFTLLSAARNPQNTWQSRLNWAEQLVKVAKKRSEAMKGHGVPDNLFALVHAVYEVYEAYLRGSDLSRPVGAVKAWCDLVQKHGFPGWRQRLEPILEAINGGGREKVEELCDAIPYH